MFGSSFSCREISRLVSRLQDAPPSSWERVKLRLHLTFCDACTRFDAQMRVLREAMRRYRSVTPPARVSWRLMVSLIVNGEARTLAPESASVAALVRELGFEGKRVAVERNGEIIPKSLYDATALADGDTLEIVRAVGGG